MTAKLRCTLYPGQFSSELAVVLESHAGRALSLFAQKNDLDFSGTPSDDQPIEGWIKVEVLKREGDSVLVRLPQSTIENGQFITVPSGRLTGFSAGSKACEKQEA